MDKNTSSTQKVSPDTELKDIIMQPEDVEANQEAQGSDSHKHSNEGLKSTNGVAQEPTFFSDERGNLKVVNTIVRHPCKVFWFVLVLCLFLVFLLQSLVFATAEGGSPFTEPGNEFDINDVRSIQYDSLRLARDVVSDTRGELKAASEVKQVRSEVADFLYWVYESETSEGVFGSVESIEGMKDSFDIFLEDEEFLNWCTLDYRTKLAPNATRGCTTPLTPLAMYYASTWDSEKVAIVIEQLKDPSKLALLNGLAGCFTLGLRCDQLTNSTAQADIAWVTAITTNITSIASTWDMKGSLVENHTQVTELASYLLKVDIFKGLVDFGFDKGFNTDNPVSRYSRGILRWGGPLENQTSDSEADDRRKA